jgi:hypothetical protein
MYVNGDEHFESIYGKNHAFSGGGIDYLIFIKGKDGIGFSLDFIWISPRGETTYSKNKVMLSMIPISLSALYIRRFGRLLPYVGVGGEYFYFQENYPESFYDVSFTDTTFGYNIQLGTFLKISSSLYAKAYFKYHSAATETESRKISLGGNELGLRLSYHFNIK